jgi:hypothetical protein
MVGAAVLEVEEIFLGRGFEIRKVETREISLCGTLPKG